MTKIIASSFATLFVAITTASAQFPVVLNIDAATDGIMGSAQGILNTGRIEIGWLAPGTTQAQVQGWFAAADFASLDAAFNQVGGFTIGDPTIDFVSGGGQFFDSIELVANGDTAGLAAFNNPTTGAKGKEMFSWVRDTVNPLATTEMAFVKFGLFPTTNDPLGSDWADTFIHSAPAVPWIGSIVSVPVGGAIDNLGGGNTPGDGLGATGSSSVLQLAVVPEPTTGMLVLGGLAAFAARRRRSA